MELAGFAALYPYYVLPFQAELVVVAHRMGRAQQNPSSLAHRQL
jgi:hypothetical protein